MKIDEVMVGDLVLHDGKVIRVNAVYKRKIGFHKTKDKLTWLFSGQFQPIHLTQEILEKNGFVYADLPFEYFYEGYGLRIYGGNFADGHSNWYIICGINVSMSVTHVHELQHALRLCKIEKEIVV